MNLEKRIVCEIDIANVIAVEFGQQQMAERIVIRVFSQLEHHLKNGSDVVIKNFGVFSCRKVELHGKNYHHYKITTPKRQRRNRITHENVNASRRTQFA
jgi:nucleoid DNA-binding protein